MALPARHREPARSGERRAGHRTGDCGVRISDCGFKKSHRGDVVGEWKFVFSMTIFDSIDELSESIRDKFLIWYYQSEIHSPKLGTRPKGGSQKDKAEI